MNKLNHSVSTSAMVRGLCGAMAVSLIALAGWVATPASKASAQQVELNQFRPSEITKDGFAVSTADSQGHLKFGIQAYVDYARNPLVLSGSTLDRDYSVVKSQLNLHGNISLGLWDRLVLYAGLPYTVKMKGDSLSAVTVGGTDTDYSSLEPNQSKGLGDTYVGARVRLFGEREDVFQLAVQGALNIYTASMADEAQNYLGESDVKPRIGGHPELLFTFNGGEHFRFSGNVGYLIRPKTSIAAPSAEPVLIGQELTYGAGIQIPFLEDQLTIIAEMFGRTGLSSKLGSTEFGDKEETPMEVLGGLKYRSKGGFALGAGAGGGVLRGYGAPDWRVLGMIGYAMPEKDEPKPPADTDGDGIVDDLDACPMRAEDMDGFEDADGCPDNDNDGDGIADADDGAPNDPEDVDGFQDEDGVPDTDNDGDGILDGDDKCPNEAGSAEMNGCPDPDRDGDGVPDRLDNCPDEAGPVENEGCQKKQLVKIEKDRLRILDKVYFKTGSSRIQSRSFELLDNVAQVIKNHPEVGNIRVEGHTDTVGRLQYNMGLSNARADKVRKYLIYRGVESDRLVSKGFGPTQPIVTDAKTKDELAQNRRVEFVVVKSADGGEATAE